MSFRIPIPHVKVGEVKRPACVGAVPIVAKFFAVPPTIVKTTVRGRRILWTIVRPKTSHPYGDESIKF
jgi:hypothetical protein